MVLNFFFLNFFSGRTNCTHEGLEVDCRGTPNNNFGYDGEDMAVYNYGSDSTCNSTNRISYSYLERDRCYVDGKDSVRYASVQTPIRRDPYSFYYWRYKNNQECKGNQVETISKLDNACFKTDLGYLSIASGNTLKIQVTLILFVIFGILFQ